MKPNCLLRFYLLQASAALILLRRRSLCGTGALALILSASTVQAAVSITGNYGGATAPTINSTYGTLEFALNMGGSALTRDGVAFTTAGTTPSGATRNFLTSGGVGATINVVGVTQGGNRAWSQATLSGSTDGLFHTIAFANHGSSPGYEITVSGLDAGKSYQLQFLFGDPRTAFPYSNTVTAFDSSSNNATATVSYGSASSGDEFSMLTAVVSGSTSFKFRSFKEASGGGPGIAGLVVHSVPEPSAALLGGLGLLALLRRRRA
jgi:MYXO-CTERM domain-containing protein